MKYFFTALKNIKLVDFKSEYLELFPGVRITKNIELREKLLSEEIRDVIGIVEFNHLIQSETILYFEYEKEYIDEHFSDYQHLELLELILVWIDDFLKNSWIVKDNSFVCDTGFLIDEMNNPQAEASSSRLNYIHTISEGGIDVVELTEIELKEMIDTHDLIEMYLHSKDSMSYQFSMRKNYSRIGRFMFFIKHARESRNLGHKILNYCSALETLMSTDNFEIAHKIGERTAFLLADKNTKLDTYKSIKRAYGIRSKLTHGASVDNKLIEQMPDISKELDSILRTLIRKIIKDEELLKKFDSNNQILNDYFTNLILA